MARFLHAVGLRATHVRSLALGSIGLSLALWIRAKTDDQERRGNAERRAIFVGLWPFGFHLVAEALERDEGRRRRL